MPDQPLITFGIPAYNRPQLLAETLASLAAQQGPADFEVVVCDDGGLPESGGSIVVWWNSDGSKWLLIHATAGGIASGIGAPIGLAIGNLASIESIDEQYINWLLRNRRSGGGGADNVQEMPWNESAGQPPQPEPPAPAPAASTDILPFPVTEQTLARPKAAAKKALRELKGKAVKEKWVTVRFEAELITAKARYERDLIVAELNLLDWD